MFKFKAHTLDSFLSYSATSLTINMSPSIISVGSAVNFHGHQTLSWPNFIKAIRSGGHNDIFHVCSVATTIHGKTGKKSWEQFALFFQRVNIRAELLLCYTLLELERTSWSRSHIFHSLTCLLTWAGCPGAATTSCDRFTSVAVALHVALTGLSCCSVQIKHLPAAFSLNLCIILCSHENIILDANITKWKV